MINLIDVYPYRYISGKYQYLILQRSADKQYAGQWRMIGGKVRNNEKAWQCALRELQEETGATPVTFWAVPSVNHYYDHLNDLVQLIPAFAAQLEPDCDINLDDEHNDFRWIECEAAKRYLRWPEQIRLLTLIHTILTSHELPEDWKISL